MSAATSFTPGRAVHQSPRLSFAGVVKAEWIKLFTIRPAYWMYPALVLLTVLVVASMTHGLSDGGANVAAPDARTSLVLGPVVFATMLTQLLVVTLAAVVVGSEFSSGTIRTTFAAEPRRVPTLAAKSIVLGTATFVVSLVANLLGYLIVDSTQKPGPASLFIEQVVPRLLGGSLYLALVAVLALAVAMMLRSAASTIAALVGLLLVVPSILGQVPVAWLNQASSYLPSSAGQSMYTAPSLLPTGDSSGVVLSLFVLLAWVAAAWAGAAIVTTRRPA